MFAAREGCQIALTASLAPQRNDGTCTATKRTGEGDCRRMQLDRGLRPERECPPIRAERTCFHPKRVGSAYTYDP
jgi:hypothetical protein